MPAEGIRAHRKEGMGKTKRPWRYSMASVVLIVDDDARWREALEGVLAGQGYELSFAGSGSEAIQKAAQLSPDVILLDVMMPDMDGFEVCRKLRTDTNLADVPIVMVTALEDQDSRIQGIESGADDFITKPVNRIELRARIRTITRLNRYRKLLEDRKEIESAHLALQQAYDTTIEGWARALELRDIESAGHSRRVTGMTVLLATECGMKEEQLVHMRRGALLHDIGKMGIPDTILFKPGPLTEEEWEVMHQHPIYARNLLAPVPFLHPALDIPYYHHEKWDGTGYPERLKGESIPLAARLFAPVDVWDALSSDRSYRKAWHEEKICEHLKALAGKHFDPQIVTLFLRMLYDERSLDLKRIKA